MIQEQWILHIRGH